MHPQPSRAGPSGPKGKLGVTTIVGFERGAAAVRTALGDTAFTAAWNAGLALSLEEAVAEALDDEPTR
jgi:hypothetical protein